MSERTPPAAPAWPPHILEAAALALMTPSAREHADTFHDGKPGPGHIADVQRVLDAIAPHLAAERAEDRDLAAHRHALRFAVTALNTFAGDEVRVERGNGRPAADACETLAEIATALGFEGDAERLLDAILPADAP